MVTNEIIAVKVNIDYINFFQSITKRYVYEYNNYSQVRVEIIGLKFLSKQVYYANLYKISSIIYSHTSTIRVLSTM